MSPKLRLLLITGLLASGSAAGARDNLGVFESWGAFRDPAVPRCYAIAEPDDRVKAGSRWRPFAAIGFWPRQGVRGQINIRLSRSLPANARIMVQAGQRSFAMVGGGADAWAPDRQTDAAIIAAIRSEASMTVRVSAPVGGFTDSYALRGAATAIDAAALGCGRLR